MLPLLLLLQGIAFGMRVLENVMEKIYKEEKMRFTVEKCKAKTLRYGVTVKLKETKVMQSD